MSTTTPRAKSPRARIQLRVSAREAAEIQQATKQFGSTSAAALLLSLVRQRNDAEALAVQLERQLQAVVQVAVGSAVASLGDRLAANLAALSTSVAAIAEAVDDRPTKAQLNGFLAHVQGRPASQPNAPAGASPTGATLAPKGGAQ